MKKKKIQIRDYLSSREGNDRLVMFVSLLLTALFIAFRAVNDIFDIKLDSVYFIGTCWGFSSLFYLKGVLMNRWIYKTIVYYASMFFLALGMFHLYYWVVLNVGSVNVYYALIISYVVPFYRIIKWKQV